MNNYPTKNINKRLLCVLIGKVDKISNKMFWFNEKLLVLLFVDSRQRDFSFEVLEDMVPKRFITEWAIQLIGSSNGLLCCKRQCLKY